MHAKIGRIYGNGGKYGRIWGVCREIYYNERVMNYLKKGRGK